MLSPSQYEGSSVSVIESLVSGLPVIASPASSETVGEKLTMSLDNPGRGQRGLWNFQTLTNTKR